MENFDDCLMEQIAKAWTKASEFSESRLKKALKWNDKQLDDAIREGFVTLETVCLIVHAVVKPGQYKLPFELWRFLHFEYGIVVYPSALTEDIAVNGLDETTTFTEAYHGHIVMFKKRDTSLPPLCPFEYIREPPPAYQK